MVVSRKKVRAELDGIQDERREQGLFEEGSVEERAEAWKELVGRTGRILLTKPGIHNPFDGKYNARSESSGVVVEKEDGVSAVLSFAISHEQPGCRATEYDDAQARYIQAILRHALVETSVVTSPKFVTLSAHEYVVGDPYGYVHRKQEIAEFTAALGLAEATIAANTAG